MYSLYVLTVSDYTAIATYEPLEVTCDGLDNDCDSKVDYISTNLASRQGGPCLGLWQKCSQLPNGTFSTVDDYSTIPNFQFNETACDNYDNDCTASNILK